MRFLFILLMFACEKSAAQNMRHITLAEVVDLAKSRSIAARQAETARETRYWEYRAFQSDFKPQLVLSGSLPSFSRAFREVWQPNGTVLFQPVRNNNSSLSLSLQQNIARTGSKLFAITQMQRFDDFDRKTTLYNGAPLTAIGIEQPLLQFNAMKWDNKIEPLRYEESRRAYTEEMEYIGSTACTLYFSLLLAQVNADIAATNLKNTEEILRIARAKYDLGKTARNELLQLELEELKAQKAVAAAQRDATIADLELRSYCALPDGERLHLEEPLPVLPPDAAVETLLTEALANRADALAFLRRRLEAERAVAKAKGDNGINLTLSANVGLANSANQFDAVLRQPQDYQAIRLQMDVPVLDWGRSKARIKTAQANKQLAEYTIQQDQQTFRQQLVTAVSLYQLLKSQLNLNAQADKIAEEQYQIARERYLLGNLDVMNLSLSLAEKDRAKRDYIGVLRDYWNAWFSLRRLTLYDLEKQQKI